MNKSPKTLGEAVEDVNAAFSKLLNDFKFACLPQLAIPKHIRTKLPKAKLFQARYLGKDAPFMFKYLRLGNSIRLYALGAVCEVRAPWIYEKAKAQHPELFMQPDWIKSLSKLMEELTYPERLRAVYQRHRQWSDETFGTRDQKGPIGPLKHLKDECDEAMENPNDISEFVDLQFLVWDSAYRAGHDLRALTDGCEQKMPILLARKYPQVPDGMPSFHIKGGGDDA
jgi:hypothetical protein